MKPLKVFVGYDKAETAAFQVCAYSIQRNASGPVAIIPLNIRHFPDFTNNDYKSSTDFAFTRFLVPWLSGYEGYSVFMDADMLVRGDIYDILPGVGDKDVYCVQHDYRPKMGDKFLGAEQTDYQYKNWSSVMVFNNERCKNLTFDYVNSTPGLDLHQFKWTEDEKIGKLPPTWNYLVGEDTEYNPDPSIVHYTRGGPYFKEYEHCDFAKEWFDYYRESISVLDKRIVGGA
jgi:hypothetical protein